ncbi:MAG: hypothetical protein FOGNACKC_04157 [Anaerolineae bacterium]|nr:hypothetical protein [Anaerolineae bacterium]
MMMAPKRWFSLPLPQKLKQLLHKVLAFFTRLQWKLTLAYTGFTAATILVLGGAAVGFIWYTTFRSNALPLAIASALQKASPLIAAYLEPEPNLPGLERWLDSVMQDENLIIPLPRDDTAGNSTDTMPAQFGRVVQLAIVNPAGETLAGYPPESVPAGAPFVPAPETAAIFAAAQAGQTEPDQLSMRDSNGDNAAAVPILGQNGQQLGAIYLIAALPIGEMELVQLFFQGTILPAAAGMLVVGVLAGLLFGYLISRGLTRRLKRLALTADGWSQGDFGQLAYDQSGDELGQLARHLNHMAIQLQNLLQTRQELATLEERNRLARDLHDSVKQQVFATAMQIGAAKVLIEQQPDAAKGRILEAEQLIKQSQQELTSLINELRPAALEGKGLAKALQDYAADWSRQTSVSAEVRVRGERPLPLSLEQTLFRVAQEGLANVARHSHASAVEIDLAWEPDGLTLTITDNGQGFNVIEPNGQGVGLKSMNERIAAAGGCLSVKSLPGHGTQITARLANIN